MSYTNHIPCVVCARFVPLIFYILFVLFELSYSYLIIPYSNFSLVIFYFSVSYFHPIPIALAVSCVKIKFIYPPRMSVLAARRLFGGQDCLLHEGIGTRLSSDWLWLEGNWVDLDAAVPIFTSRKRSFAQYSNTARISFLQDLVVGGRGDAFGISTPYVFIR